MVIYENVMEHLKFMRYQLCDCCAVRVLEEDR